MKRFQRILHKTSSRFFPKLHNNILLIISHSFQQKINFLYMDVLQYPPI